MLATAIISSAFPVGDSVTYGIKNSAAASLRSVDEILVVYEDSNVWEGRALPGGFSESVFQELAPALDADSDVDGVLPTLAENVAAINSDSQQFESSARLAGLDPQRAMVFDELFDTGGEPIDLTVLRPNEVYFNADGAEALLAGSGSELSLALGPGMLTPITVRGVVDGSYSKPAGTDVVLMASLSSVQQLLGRPGELSAVLNSNRGAVIGVGLGFVLVLVSAFQAAHLPFFGLGISVITLGVAMAVRALGVTQRRVFTGVGLFLVIYRLVPHSFLKSLKPDFTEDMSGFFLVGTFLVTGAVLVTVNNAPIVLSVASKTIGRVRRYTPIVKSAVAYPLQSRYRTGLSLAMFSIVIFSVTVMATFVDVLDNLLGNQERLGGGYEVVGFVGDDFFATNRFGIALPSDQFTLNDVEGLLVENDYMDPVNITVRDLESGNTLDLTVIGVLDTLASAGPVPVGFYVSPRLSAAASRRHSSSSTSKTALTPPPRPLKRLSSRTAWKP